MVLATGLLALIGFMQLASVLGVGGVILFSIGVILWHIEP